jgi:hypothetical protein
MKLLAVSLVSWVAGLIAYVAALGLVWGQTISGGDLNAVLLWSGLAAAVVVVAGFAPVMFAIHRRLGGRPAGLWVFPSVGILLGAVPVVLILTLWSDDLFGALFSAEAGLFFSMFATFGAVFGAGFFLAYARRSASRSH